jgi:GTP-dependent phosphoenolpyruvate carboxykinase
MSTDVSEENIASIFRVASRNIGIQSVAETTQGSDWWEGTCDSAPSRMQEGKGDEVVREGR